MTSITTSIAPQSIEDHLKNATNDIEEMAERELTQASSVIANAITRMMKAQEEAK